MPGFEDTGDYLVHLIGAPAGAGTETYVHDPWPRNGYISIRVSGVYYKFDIRPGGPPYYADYVPPGQFDDAAEEVSEGPTGATGPQGEPGPTGPVGPQGDDGESWHYEGPWQAGTTYDGFATVERNGSSYASISPLNLGQPPESSPDAWGLIAAKGDTGAQGPKGDKGDKGDTGEQGPAGPAGSGGGGWTASYIEPFDDLSAFTFDIGSAADVTVSGGMATPTNDAEKVMFRQGVNVQDGKALLRFVPQSGNWDAGIAFRRLNSAEFLLVNTYQAGGMGAYKREGGTYVAFNSVSGIPARTAGVPCWLVCRWAGRYIRVEFWEVDPRLVAPLEWRGAGPVLASMDVALTNTDYAKFGTINGPVGIRMGTGSGGVRASYDELSYGPSPTLTSSSDF
jgi:hypothetical protein